MSMSLQLRNQQEDAAARLMKEEKRMPGLMNEDYEDAGEDEGEVREGRKKWREKNLFGQKRK